MEEMLGTTKVWIAKLAAIKEADNLIRQLRQRPLSKFTLDDLDGLGNIEERINRRSLFVSTLRDRKFLRELLSRVGG